MQFHSTIDTFSFYINTHGILFFQRVSFQWHQMPRYASCKPYQAFKKFMMKLKYHLWQNKFLKIKYTAAKQIYDVEMLLLTVDRHLLASSFEVCWLLRFYRLSLTHLKHTKQLSAIQNIMQWSESHTMQKTAKYQGLAVEVYNNLPK